MFRIVAALFCVLFLFSAAVQFNDPDPWIWIIAYLIPAALAALAGANRYYFRLSVAACASYILAALLVFPGWLPEWFDHEEFREAGGLAICVIWLAVLGWRAWRKQSV